MCMSEGTRRSPLQEKNIKNEKQGLRGEGEWLGGSLRYRKRDEKKRKQQDELLLFLQRRAQTRCAISTNRPTDKSEREKRKH
jgi:hypothetical protein